MTTETLIDEHHTRRDLKQLESAIRKGWKIPDSIYEQTAFVIGQILSKGTPRDKLAAAKVLLAMNAQNNPQPAIQPAATTINVGVSVDAAGIDERRRRTLAIAQRFGAGGVLLVDNSGQG